jgi:ribosomal protein L37AE/L43A
MANLIECPACRHELQVPPELLNQLVKCPLCSKTFAAPASIRDFPSGPIEPPATGTQPAAPTLPLQPPGPTGQPIRRGFHCPFCGSDAPPVTREQISLAGWIVFAVMLVTCFPLFWIGLLMKEEAKFCGDCGRKLSGDSL